NGERSLARRSPGREYARSLAASSLVVRSPGRLLMARWSRAHQVVGCWLAGRARQIAGFRLAGRELVRSVDQQSVRAVGGSLPWGRKV
ncbi:UNVERIFIED_CONTAM: hypothetical protein Slati_0002400, partial [Sesamum latifolium]